MTFQVTIKTIACCALFSWSTASFSHVSLAEKSAPAGSSYKAVFQVGHGCQGSATTGISVQIPAGWTLTTQLAKLAKPYDNHGTPVTQDVALVSWAAASREAALQDAHFDEFMLRGKLPEAAGPLWFKVLQTCENGSNDWSEVPASGTSAKGLKSPAVLLDVTGAATPGPGAHAAHQH